MFQRYAGAVPPFVQVAVNVTVDPWHTGFDDETIVTETGLAGLTLIVMGFEITVFPDEGQEILDVISHTIISFWAGS